MFGKRLLLTTALCLGYAAVLVLGQAVTPAPACTDDIREDNCTLPACRCSGNDIPGNLVVGNVPQLVFLTFDDAVAIQNIDFYREVLYNRKNPNNQTITATFFITHEYTNYTLVHELYRYGHDIALHSMSHNPLTAYWASLNQTMWRAEVVDQREQLSQFARVPTSEIKGLRAPFLQIGGDDMYNVLKQANFQWECSRPTLNFRKPGLWPYTNDYRSTQDCQIAPCPVGEYKGFWTVPMIDMMGNDNEGCAMVDTCTPVPETADQTYDLLLKNFNDHYTTNKAPFGIFTHAAWLNGTDDEGIEARRAGYVRFLDFLGTKNDVYIVGISRAIEWVKTPTPLAQLANFTHFQNPLKPNQCPNVYNCRYAPEQTPFPTERYMSLCAPCPPLYPWVGNPLGRP
ncbi:unnamed protein product [Orchesella dallaii]|uniref:NodB homology domain-containing protein n=1 Tax=Orchesella dallaii TaxID=48710 RepID=A0ABP1PS78_9HEXA